MRKRIIVWAAVAVGGALWAEPIVWVGGTDMSWNTAANWNPATVPNASGAEVDLSAASGTITLGSAVTVGSIDFSPTSAKTLTLSGSGKKMTFAGGSTPTVTVKTGSTLVTSCYHGGTQGLVKLGGGAFNPLANSSGNNFSGVFEVREGSSTPVKIDGNGRFSGGIKVATGATFTLASADMYASAQTFEMAGGTFTMNAGDYVGAITLNNNGKLDGKWNQLYLDNGAEIKATGTGNAGLLDKTTLRVNGVFSAPTAAVSNHIQPFDVAAGASLSFYGYIYEGLHQNSADYYMLDYRNNCSPARGADRWRCYGGMTKKGAGDLYLIGSSNERSTLTLDTKIEAGRIILTNNFKICLSKVVAKSADALVIAPNQSSPRVGALELHEGTLDLNGTTLDVGGADGAAVASAKVSNGSIRKISHTHQTVAGLSQSALDVYGGELDLGIPAPVVRYDFDDASAPLNDSGALGKHLSWSSADAGVWHSDGGVRGGCVEMTKVGSWGRTGDANVPSSWVFTYGGGWLEAETCAGLPTGGKKPISIVVWVKPNGTVNGKQSLVGWGRWGAELNDAGTGQAGGYKAMGFCVSKENGQSNALFARPWSGDWKSPSVPNLDDGNWHHVVYVYDPVYHVDRYYVDGELFLEATNLSQTEFNIDTTRRFTVGGGQLYAGTFMGKMDELMIFDQVLGADQVRLLASSANTASRTAGLAANASVRIGRGASLGFAAAPQTLSSLTGDGKVVLNDAEVTLDNASAASAATVTGSGTFTKRGSGTLTLDGATATGGRIALEQGAIVAKGASVSADLKSHLKGWWNFDDPANRLKDSSGHGLDLMENTRVDNGTVHEAWNWRNHFEKMSGAAWFNGNDAGTLICTDAAALTAALPRGNASFTIALWVKPDSTCSSRGTFFTYYHATAGDEGGHWNMFRFNNTTPTKLHHVFYGGDGTPTADLPTGFFSGDEFGGWHHLVFSYDKDTKVNRFYVDGVQLGNDVVTSSNPNMQTEVLCIGGSKGNRGGDPFKGYLDDVMIFDKVLSADEVKSIMSGFADEPAGGAAVTAASGTTLSVARGTVGLGSVNGAGAVSVATNATLVLAAGDSALSGALSGEGAIRMKGGASLQVANGTSYAGAVSVATNAALCCVPGVSASVGSLALAEGASFKVTHGESTDACWSAPTIALPAAATVDLNGAVVGNHSSVVLLEATTTLSGDTAGWTIENSPEKMTVSVRRRGNKVVLTVAQSGTMLLVR